MGEQDHPANYPRAELLAALGTKGWYTDHVGSERCPGRCLLAAPDPTCDVGVALYQLRKKS